jgi:hypothetical protein
MDKGQPGNLLTMSQLARVLRCAEAVQPAVGGGGGGGVYSPPPPPRPVTRHLLRQIGLGRSAAIYKPYLC